MMPGKDGIETLKELREQADNPNLSTPTVCLTANAISGAGEWYLSNGFDDYLTKPVDSGKLEEMMITYLPKDKVCLERDKEESGSLPDELSRLKSCEEIDLAAGINNSGNVDSYLSLLEIFYDTVSDKKEEIISYLENSDIKNYTIKVHAMKSSLRIIGALEAGEEAQKLENAGKAEDMDYIREHNEPFLDRCIQIKGMLEEIFVREESGSDKPVADETLMAEVYSEIRSAAEEMDCDRLEEITLRMKEYQIPEQEAGRFQLIEKKNAMFDYEGILKVLQ